MCVAHYNTRAYRFSVVSVRETPLSTRRAVEPQHSPHPSVRQVSRVFEDVLNHKMNIILFVDLFEIF